MKLILSPTKTMVFERTSPETGLTRPAFDTEAGQLIQRLSDLDLAGLEKLYKTSSNLTQKTRDQIRDFDRAVSGPALFSFRGEAFKTLAPQDFSLEDLAFASDCLRILSGLYGVLAPMDRIRPYRLDFNTPLAVGPGSLKKYWQAKLVPFFESLLEPGEPLVNLASDEYSSALASPLLKAQMITLKFREIKDGRMKNLATRAKQARGMFARAIVLNRITRPEDLKSISPGGYTFTRSGSDDQTYLFLR